MAKDAVQNLSKIMKRPGPQVLVWFTRVDFLDSFKGCVIGSTDFDELVHWRNKHTRMTFQARHIFNTKSFNCPTAWLTGAEPQAERPVEPVLGAECYF
jgi:hypothetical protein